MTRGRTILVLLTVLVLIAGSIGTAYVLTRDDDNDTTAFTPPEPVAAGVPEGLDRFYEQQVDWSDCADAQCATVTVPIDYDEPDGETIRLRMTLYPATGGTAERSLLVNPGGPGGSAIDFAETLSTELGDDVREMYNVVGVDPRGVGTSSPLECLSDEEFDEFAATDPDPDDAAEIAELRASITRLGGACRDNSGELASHVSTVEVARDMDVVRALLGEEQLDWFGASYGTELGAVYADLFPERVGRMVLDGAVDPSQDSVEASFAQTTGFQRAIEAYAKDCVTKSGCPLGDDAEAGIDKVADLLRSLDADPLPTQDGRTLTEGLAFYGVAVTLYDKETWQYLTQGLDAAFQGDGSVLLILSDAYFERDQQGRYGNNGGQVIYAVNCLDSPGGLSLAQTQAVLPRFERASPVFGSALGWGALNCTDWPLEATNPTPTIDAKGAAPIVVIGTTRDPATPYESAEALAEQLESAVLLTRDGDGHTAYLSGNECITDAVDTYLVTGEAPQDGTTCD